MAEEKKLNEKLEKIAKEIEGLTTLELADLSKYLEEKFGVSAMPVAAVAAGAGQVAAPSEEKTSFNVVLTDAGANKLGVIKVVREINPSLGLMEAKKFVESTPKELLSNVKKTEAEEAKKKIEQAGGKAELK